MKSINKYILEKLKITKDNIYKHSIAEDILDVKIEYFDDIRKKLDQYFSTIYSDNEVIVGNLRQTQSLEWDLERLPSNKIKTISISAYFVINVILPKGSFSIHVGQERGLSQRVLFRYKYTDSNGNQGKSFAISPVKEYRFKVKDNLLDWLLTLKDEVIDSNCHEEIQLLKYFKLIEE